MRLKLNQTSSLQLSEGRLLLDSRSISAYRTYVAVYTVRAVYVTPYIAAAAAAAAAAAVALYKESAAYCMARSQHGRKRTGAAV